MDNMILCPIHIFINRIICC